MYFSKFSLFNNYQSTIFKQFKLFQFNVFKKYTKVLLNIKLYIYGTKNLEILFLETKGV